MKKFEWKKSVVMQRKYFIILLVCVVTGFIIGYSYNLTKEHKQSSSSLRYYYQQSDAYREELIAQQERNKQLSEELGKLQQKIRQYEKEVSTNNIDYEQKVKEAERLRLLLGELEGVGEGIIVTLKDSEYNGVTNPNDYVVHESHIFKVLQELKISGAEAIAINGHRLRVNSYINCNGPVITIDGEQYPAPFQITAIGNSNSLYEALNIAGGIIDQLVNEKVVVIAEKRTNLQISSIHQGNL